MGTWNNQVRCIGPEISRLIKLPLVWLLSLNWKIYIEATGEHFPENTQVEVKVHTLDKSVAQQADTTASKMDLQGDHQRSIKSTSGSSHSEILSSNPSVINTFFVRGLNKSSNSVWLLWQLLHSICFHHSETYCWTQCHPISICLRLYCLST